MLANWLQSPGSRAGERIRENICSRVWPAFEPLQNPVPLSFHAGRMLVEPDIVDGHDVGMVQRGGQSGFVSTSVAVPRCSPAAPEESPTPPDGQHAYRGRGKPRPFRVWSSASVAAPSYTLCFTCGVGSLLDARSAGRKLLNLLEDRSDGRRLAGRKSSKRVHDAEATPVEEFYSANTSCSVFNAAVSVFAETTPSFFASRILSTART